MKSLTGEYRLLSDSPCTAPRDPLGYDVIAYNLEKLITGSRSSTPLTIGIQGGWGTGKSTLMEKLRTHLQEERARARTVKFNAWLYDGRNITEGLIKTILSSFDDDNLVRNTFRRRRAMAFLRLALSIAAGYFGIGRAVDQAWQAIAQDTEMTNRFQDTFREMVRKWAEKRRKEDERRQIRADRRRRVGWQDLFVVFIDDLDRCGSDRVMQLLEAVKLYLGVKNLVFVIGYDRSPIVARIEEKIGSSKLVTGDQYMEKIIQIPFGIPVPTDKQLREYLKECLRESGAGPHFKDLEEIIISGNDRNPRKIKLFLNTFIVENSIRSPEERVAPSQLSRILLMQLYFHQFYRQHFRKDRTRVQMLAEFVDVMDALREDKVFHELPPPIQESLRRNAKGEISFEDQDDAANVRKKVMQVFPEDFESFSQDRELVKLVKSLAAEWAEVAEEDKERVYQQVLKSEELANVAQQQELRQSFVAKVGDTKARILWVDDHPENNEQIRERMIPYSVINTVVTSTEEALKELAVVDFDWVVSDIARGDDYEAGFKLASIIREELQKDTKVIFYTGRVTQSRREKAYQLSANITSDPYELVNLLMSELTPTAK